MAIDPTGKAPRTAGGAVGGPSPRDPALPITGRPRSLAEMQFVAGLRYEDLPPRIAERVKDILRDTIASAIAEAQR